MSAVSETIVREYFELHGFFVRQLRKYITPSRREDDEADFLVLNPRAQVAGPTPFVLSSTDLAGLARALIVEPEGLHCRPLRMGIHLVRRAPGVHAQDDVCVCQPGMSAGVVRIAGNRLVKEIDG